MHIDELGKIIKGRRSIRSWREDDVPDDLLKKAIELASWAPNGHNFQGWYFIVVKDQGIKEKMGQATQSAIDNIASWPEVENWRAQMDRSQKMASNFVKAPACVAVFVSNYQSHFDKILALRKKSDDEALRIRACRKFAPTSIQSVAAAVTIMLLAFHTMGLGAVWMVAPLLAKEKIESILKPPPETDLVCIVAVGYPDEIRKSGRKPVEKVLEFRS